MPELDSEAFAGRPEEECRSVAAVGDEIAGGVLAEDSCPISRDSSLGSGNGVGGSESCAGGARAFGAAGEAERRGGTWVDFAWLSVRDEGEESAATGDPTAGFTRSELASVPPSAPGEGDGAEVESASWAGAAGSRPTGSAGTEASGSGD